MIQINKKILCVLVCSQLVVINAQCQALTPDSQQVLYYGEKPIFRLNFYDYHEDAAVVELDGGEYKSTYNLSNGLRAATAQGVDYIAQLLGAGTANSQPVEMYIFTYNYMNADATGGGPDVPANSDLLQQAFYQNEALGAMTGGYIRIGIMDNDDVDKGWYTGYGSQLPDNGNQFHLSATLAHETLHALGVLSNSLFGSDEDETASNEDYGKFIDPLNAFSSHLYDAKGDQAKRGMDIIDPTSTNYQPGNQANEFWVYGKATQADEGGAYFSGTNVQEVLDGAWLGAYKNEKTGTIGVPGVPINGWENDGAGGITLDISHLELRNGLMSHFNYRNYTTFMEAELAVLQDIGYTIDRRNWFGRSVYNDNLTLVNYDGYSARTADGTAYLDGAPNTTRFGVGLHVYGSNNKITQVGDILTDGLAGIGIRVDGLQGNHVTVAPGTKIHANGTNGTGLLVAYGKNHNLKTYGDVQALGAGGIAARFDFGDNILGNNAEYRGSYVKYGSYLAENGEGTKYGNIGLNEELDGPLVKNFTVGGTLAGSAAAIYIAPNAFVKNINIQQGAQLYGDIVSDWMDFSGDLDMTQYGDDYDRIFIQYYGDGKKGDMVTQLNFDADLAYSGNITGEDNMQLNVKGGQLLYTGTADILNVNVAKNASLLGGSYTLNKQEQPEIYTDTATGVFTNNGLIGALTPLDADTVMQINGDLAAEESKLQFTANKNLVGRSM